MNFIGQDNLISTFNDMKILPHTLMLKGPKGCGKHTFVKYLAEQRNLEVEDITDSLSLETIERINASPFVKIYIIDTSNINVKEQNIILKFLEEPLKSAHIFLLCPNSNYLLETINNRCLTYSFDAYSPATLATFINDKVNAELIIKLSDTPGDILSLSNIDVKDLYNFAYRVIDKMSIANIGNALTGIPGKIAFKDEQNKYSVNLFCKALLIIAADFVRENCGNRYVKYYQLTNSLWNDLQIPNINKQYLIENYIIDMKRAE